MNASETLIDKNRALYPTEDLNGLRTALVLFGAGFGGDHDGCWIQEAGLSAVVVDIDRKSLDEMKSSYPDCWQFVCDDVEDFLLQEERRFSVVSSDPPLALLEWATTLIPVFLKLATDLIVCGVPHGFGYSTPSWEQESRQRSRDVDWLILRRAAIFLPGRGTSRRPRAAPASGSSANDLALTRYSEGLTKRGAGVR